MKRVGYWEDAAPDFATARAELDEYLFDRLGGVVASGPFKGMLLPLTLAWKDARLAPMLLGCYEEELHGLLRNHIERMKDMEQPRIAVIGCADGFYAVGLKRCLPRARVFALDSDPDALSIAAQSARLNGCEIEIGRDLNEVFSYLDLIVCDCEGAEVAYLERGRFPIVASAYIIVEIHNWPQQKTDQILLDRFRGTHKIEMLREGPRDPNNYEELHQMTNDYRWLAMSEGRPAFMCWFHMTPRGAALA